MWIIYNPQVYNKTFNMSLFNPRLDNNLEIRAQKIHGEEYLVWDPGTSTWIPLTGGGGGPVELPYWVQPQQAHIYDNATRDNTVHDKLGYMVESVIDAERQKTSIRKGGVTIDDEASATGSLLSSISLTFGDAVDNSSFTKVGAKNLAEIGARIDKTEPVATDKLLLFDATANGYRTTPWLPYLKPTTLEITNANFTNTINANGSIIFSNTAGSSVGYYTTTSSIIGRRSGTTNSIDNTKGYIMTNELGYGSFSGTIGRSAALRSGGVEIQKGGVLKNLTWDNLSELVALYDKTPTVTPAAGEEMLLWNPIAKTYRYTPIASGASLPTYLKPTSIEFTGLIEINKEEGVIKSKDYTYPHKWVSLQQSGAGEACVRFSRANLDETQLIYADAKALSQLRTQAEYYDVMTPRPPVGQIENVALELNRQNLTSSYTVRQRSRFINYILNTNDVPATPRHFTNSGDGNPCNVSNDSITVTLDTSEWGTDIDRITNWNVRDGDTIVVNVTSTRSLTSNFALAPYSKRVFYIPIDIDGVDPTKTTFSASCSHPRINAKVCAMMVDPGSGPEDTVLTNVIAFTAESNITNVNGVKFYLTLLAVNTVAEAASTASFP